MLKAGLEPARLTAKVFETFVATYYTIRAYKTHLLVPKPPASVGSYFSYDFQKEWRVGLVAIDTCQRFSSHKRLANKSGFIFQISQRLKKVFQKRTAILFCYIKHIVRLDDVLFVPYWSRTNITLLSEGRSYRLNYRNIYCLSLPNCQNRFS